MKHPKSIILNAQYWYVAACAWFVAGIACFVRHTGLIGAIFAGLGLLHLIIAIVIELTDKQKK